MSSGSSTLVLNHDEAFASDEESLASIHAESDVEDEEHWGTLNDSLERATSPVSSVHSDSSWVQDGFTGSDNEDPLPFFTSENDDDTGLTNEPKEGIVVENVLPLPIITSDNSSNSDNTVTNANEGIMNEKAEMEQHEKDSSKAIESSENGENKEVGASALTFLYSLPIRTWNAFTVLITNARLSLAKERQVYKTKLETSSKKLESYLTQLRSTLTQMLAMVRKHLGQAPVTTFILSHAAALIIGAYLGRKTATNKQQMHVHDGKGDFDNSSFSFRNSFELIPEDAFCSPAAENEVRETFLSHYL